ncbi:hypothetical protein ACHAWF_010037 [Thalassiosira exigua]
MSMTRLASWALAPAAYAYAFSATSIPQPSSSMHIFYDSTNGLHRDIKYHPECPDRIDHCLDGIRRCFHSDDSGPGVSGFHLVDIAAVNSEVSSHQDYSSPLSKLELEHATTILTNIHAPHYVDLLRNKCEASRQRRIDEGKESLGWIGYSDGSDTYLTTESYDVGVRATGAWIRAVDSALGLQEAGHGWDGNCTKPVGIALTRPPGHHATHSLSNGFCIFNFAMAAAAHALSVDPNIKISILDWDVHFGQGLMDILCKCSNDSAEYDWTSNVRYASLHQVPAFPYEGQSRKVQGIYRNVMTIPIQPESTWHCGYKELFTTYALPFVSATNDWEPDLIIVCAGYDALDSDELASVNLVAKDYGEMTRLLLERISRQTHRPALVFGLEGGYQLRAEVGGGNLSDALVETMRALHT